MKRRRMVWIAIVAMAVVVVVVLAPNTPHQVITFPDGRKFMLYDVTYGKVHRYSFGNPLQKICARLPGNLGQRWGGSWVVDSGKTDDEALDLWFIVEGAMSHQRYQSIGTSFVRDGYPVSVGSDDFHASPLPDGRMPREMTFSSWPRRDPTMTLSFRVSPKTNEGYFTTNITVRNPAYRRYPTWTPDRLPAIRERGGVTFTLEDLVSDVGEQLKVERLVPVRWTINWTRLVLRAQENSRASNDWVPWGMVLTDATGNRHVPMWRQQGQQAVLPDSSTDGPAPALPNPDSRTHVNVNWAVMPCEKSVKLGVEFVGIGNIPTNRTYTLRGVPLTAGSLFATNLPVGRVCLVHGREDGTSDRRFRLLVCDPPPAPWSIKGLSSRRFVMISATDDRGTILEVKDHRKVYYATTARTLDITLTAPPIEWVEWIIPVGGTNTNRE